MCTIAYIKNRPKRAKQDIITYKEVVVISHHLIISKCTGPLIGTIVECLIPAGSKIVTGIDKGLIVSDQIIITDVIAHI